MVPASEGTSQRTFDLVVACDRNNGIGKNNELPWRIPSDLKYFRKVTVGDGAKRNVVILGRKTWESIPEKYRPLPDRINVVITRNEDFSLPGDVIRAGSLEQAIDCAVQRSAAEIFVIGGAQIYAEALKKENCRRLYVTELLATFDCDVFFPLYKDRFNLKSESELQEENGIKYKWDVYEKAL